MEVPSFWMKSARCRWTRIPELRHTNSGAAVASFSVATSRKWKDRDGQQQCETEWHRIVAWQRLAELCGEYLTKGKKVYIEGRLQTRKWQDQSGNDRYTTEIVAYDIQFLSPHGENSGYSGSGGGYDPGPGEQQSGGGADVPF